MRAVCNVTASSLVLENPGRDGGASFGEHQELEEG
jgi:hypothetical protein